MKLLVLLLALPLAAQTPKAHVKAPASDTLPPFSGTWILNLQRSKFHDERVPAVGEAIIEYDGKTWNYTHEEVLPSGKLLADWNTTLTVGDPTLHVWRKEPFVFRSRIARDGNAMVMTEFVKVDNGQTASNYIRYTLEDNGDTLVETEKETSAIGTTTNVYVLTRKHPGDPDPAPTFHDPDDPNTR